MIGGKLKFIRFSITATIIFFLGAEIYGHGSPPDPALAELNDYLMAIQIMRFYNEEAADIFDTWKELRIESGKIRELTDTQDLPARSNEVVQQVSKTRTKQKELLTELRRYFSEQMKKSPSVRIAMGKTMESDWGSPILEAPIGHSTVELIEIQNHRDSLTTLTLTSQPSDQILFWDKHLTVPAHTSRFTFIALAPLNTTQSSNIIHISDERGNEMSIQLLLRGTISDTPPFRLSPADDIFTVMLPGSDADKQDTDIPNSETLLFSLSDVQTEAPLSARVELKDSGGNNLWSPTREGSYGVNRNVDWHYRTTLWDYQPGPYFYLENLGEVVRDPAAKTVKIYHGFEYLPITMEIPEDGKIVARLKRWINMPELGWFSGQTHIHTTDMGIPVQFSQVWPIVTQAEDLHVSAILTLKGEWKTHAIYANEYPMGERSTFSSSGNIITYGEEFRNDPYGHLAIIGLKSLIQPISTGALGELGGPDYPANAYFLDEALSRGATTIAAHFGVYTQEVDQIKSQFPSTGFEMPIDVALGKIHLAEIAGLGGQMQTWYDILNCGFKIPATAGPDWFIKDTPRVYVNLGGGDFSLENWRGGLQIGNSFISTGSMLFFNVDGAQPGSTLNVTGGPVQFQINAQALAPVGALPVEIIYNGEVILKTTEPSAKIWLDDSGWVAARCEGAHSNPIFINFAGRPAGQAEPAMKFIQTIDRLEDWVEKKAIFYDNSQKTAVLEVLNEGKDVYLDIVQQAKILGRK